MNHEFLNHLKPFAAQFQAGALPCVHVKIGELTKDLTVSKIGGFPYLPLDVEYPLDEYGNPLALLAQIDCSELPPLAAFPERGMLQFFIANDDIFGLDLLEPEIQKNFRVIYHPTIDIDFQTDFDFVQGFDMLPMEEPLDAKRLHFEAGLSYPEYMDIRFDDVFGEDFFDQFDPEIEQEVWEEYFKVFTQGGHKLGGYAHFTQMDPRETDLILLFQLDSDPKNSVMWGDNGVGNFFIEEERLKNLDFSNILYHWDCY